MTRLNPNMSFFSRLFEKVSSLIDLLSEYLALAGGAVILLLMLLVSVATISRYFFGQAMAWSTEIGAFSLLIITFLGGPLLARKNAHVSVDVIPNLLGERAKKKLKFTASIVTLMVSLFIGWHALNSTIEAYVENQMIVSILRTPKFLMLAVIALGFILIAAGYLINAINQLNMSKQKKTTH